MIKISYVNRTHLLDFFQVMSNVKTLLEQEPLDELKLQETATAFYGVLALLDDKLKQAKKTGLTDRLVELDQARDAMLVGLAATIKAARMHPDTSVTTAAERLKTILDKYGKQPQELPLREETAMITQLLQDLAIAENTQAITTIAASAWVTKLREHNTAFEALYNDRTQQEALVETGATKEARQQVQEAFEKLVKTINAQAFLTGEAPYRRLIDNINRSMEQAKVSVKQRAALHHGTKKNSDKLL